MTTSPQLRWGIVGAGGIAARFVSDLVATGHTVTAIGSRNIARAQQFAAQHGLPEAYGSYKDLVASPAVDVVYVATPHSRHADDALLALNADKPVLVEKAFTQNLAQAELVAAAAESRGLFAMEAMWTRFLPHMREIHRLIDAGVIGEVQTVISDHNQLLSTDPLGRLYNPDLAGGALLDLGIYPLSFAIDILGLPDTVAAVGAKTVTGVDRQTTVLLSHAGGAQSTSQCALDQRGPNQAAVIGTRGYILIDSVWYKPTGFTVFDTSGSAVSRFDSDVAFRGMHFEADEVERCMAAGLTSSPIMPLAESVQIMRVLDEVRAQIGLVYPGEAL